MAMTLETVPFDPSDRWPRVRDLPEAEREPFTVWLAGQNRPKLANQPEDQQDGFYGWQYQSWLSHRHCDIANLKNFLHETVAPSGQ